MQTQISPIRHLTLPQSINKAHIQIHQTPQQETFTVTTSPNKTKPTWEGELTFEGKSVMNLRFLLHMNKNYRESVQKKNYGRERSYRRERKRITTRRT